MNSTVQEEAKSQLGLFEYTYIILVFAFTLCACDTYEESLPHAIRPHGTGKQGPYNAEGQNRG